MEQFGYLFGTGAYLDSAGTHRGEKYAGEWKFNVIHKR